MRDILAELERRLFDDSLAAELRWAGKEPPALEAPAAFADALDAEQAAALERIGALYAENARHGLRAAFLRGVYACFEQHFAPDAPEDPFDRYVYGQILTMPGMRREAAYRRNRIEITERLEALVSTLDETAGARVIAADGAWDEADYGVLWRSFRLGYRAALALIETVAPPAARRATEALARFEAAFEPADTPPDGPAADK